MTTNFIEWLTLADYEKAKEEAANQIDERLSRGNTAAQNGSSMERQELDCVSAAADAAMKRMRRLAAA